MATRDTFHSAVVNGLKKEHWQITHDPFYVQAGGVEFYIDLGAEKLIAAEKEGRKIAVEIKSFISPSSTYEFHLAIGQCRNYQLALAMEDPERKLYLAISQEVYEAFFELRFIQHAIRYNEVYLLIYDIRKEVIVAWLT